MHVYVWHGTLQTIRTKIVRAEHNWNYSSCACCVQCVQRSIIIILTFAYLTGCFEAHINAFITIKSGLARVQVAQKHSDILYQCKESCYAQNKPFCNIQRFRLCLKKYLSAWLLGHAKSVILLCFSS